MAARHGTREADVDRLLRDGTFVDLYPIVRRALRVGSRSYSIKKLEPLYMGAEVRTSDVQKGDDSIVRYVEARALRDDGAEAEAQQIFDDLADYNRYDCVSTRRLRDWLVDHARAAGLRPTPNPEPGENVYEPSVRAVALAALAQDWPDESRRIGLPATRGGGDRLLPARVEVVLGDALSAAARAGLAVGGDARRHGDRCRALARARGLASSRGQERTAHHRTARRARPRHAAQRRLESVRHLRAAHAVPVRAVAPLDPRHAHRLGRRSARRRRDRRGTRRRRLHVGPTADRAHARPRLRGQDDSRARSTSGPTRSSPPPRLCPRTPRPTSCCGALRARSARTGDCRSRPATTSTRSSGR